MTTFLELAKLKHHAVRSDGAKFLDGERNDSLNTSWLTVNSAGRVTLGPGLYDELLVVNGEVSDDQIKAWASMGAPFYDPTPVIPDSQIPSAGEWSSKNKTFYQTDPPVGAVVGDLWVDIDDNDRLYRWDGTKWVDITDKSPVDAEKKPVYVKGAGADIDIDKYGIRATRKADGKKTFEIDAETGDATYAGRIEAEEGYFRGDITGATGTFSGSLEAKSIKAEWFEEIRNVLPYTGSDSLDADHPIDYDFYIPSETTEIIAVKVSAVGLPFRAYSRSVKSARSQTSTSTSWSWGGASTSTDGTHTHTFSVSGSWGSTDSGGGHSHTVQFPSHHHDVTIPEHNHDMEHGIFHSTLPANVKLYCDDGHGWGSPISLGNGGVLATELDITSHFSGPGWKRIRFTSSRLGRITWQIIVKVDLTA